MPPLLLLTNDGAYAIITLYNSGEQKEFAGQIIKAQWMRVRRPNRHRSERSCAGTKIWKCWVKERIKRSGSSAFDFLQAWDAE